MMVLVTYDVNVTSQGGTRRLHQVSKICQNYGQRVQNSVFEIEVDPAQFVSLKSQLVAIIAPELDSLRYYHLGANWERRIEHVGAKAPIDLNCPLII